MSTKSATHNSRSKTALLETYLEGEVRDGETYFKSRFIAEDIDLSAHEIGATMHELEEGSDLLDIEQWGYTNGTTWRITLAE